MSFSTSSVKMPFRSKSQMRWMYANKPKMAESWSKHTSNPDDLPERSNARKKAKASKIAEETMRG